MCTQESVFQVVLAQWSSRVGWGPWQQMLQCDQKGIPGTHTCNAFHRFLKKRSPWVPQQQYQFHNIILPGLCDFLVKLTATIMHWIQHFLLWSIATRTVCCLLRHQCKADVLNVGRGRGDIWPCLETEAGLVFTQYLKGGGQGYASHTPQDSPAQQWVLTHNVNNVVGENLWHKETLKIPNSQQ